MDKQKITNILIKSFQFASLQEIMNAVEEISKLELQPQNEEVDKIKQELENLKDLLIRRSAEFENYKKRTEKEKTEMMEFANEMFLKNLLPVYDDAERVLNSLSDERTTMESLDNGIRCSFNKFQSFLSEMGVSEMDVLDKDFNVDYMDAVMTIPATQGNENKVTKVVEKGYFIGNKVLRHAKVIVAK
jgi:molecular chaperone GrpE